MCEGLRIGAKVSGCCTYQMKRLRETDRYYIEGRRCVLEIWEGCCISGCMESLCRMGDRRIFHPKFPRLIQVAS